MKDKQEQKRKAAEEQRRRSGSFEKAVGEYEKAMKLFHKRSMDEAKAHFQSVLEKFGSELEICERCRVYVRIIEEQLQPKKPRPKNAEEHYLLGTLEHNAGEYKNAIAQYEKAIELSPKDERYHYALAASFARAGMQAEALRELATALAHDEDARHMAARDEDFDSMEESEEFMKLIEREERTAGA